MDRGAWRATVHGIAKSRTQWSDLACMAVLSWESVSHSVVSDSCNPMDCSPPGSSAHGILQARILEWVAMSYSMGSSQPKDQTCISHVFCIGRQVLYHLSHQGSLDSTWLVAKTRTKHSIQGSILTCFLRDPSQKPASFWVSSDVSRPGRSCSTPGSVGKKVTLSCALTWSSCCYLWLWLSSLITVYSKKWHKKIFG